MLARGQVGKLTDRIGPRPVVLAGVVLTAAATLGFTQSAPGTSDARDGRGEEHPHVRADA
ncbi:MAG TPA: hypothetical protein VJT49_14060 [Amycolatopsis sp.]|uniref:hypothetical protein n=1 Tax=Amycolatopsis sp. TaxID=37632 RepID=UPI002B48F284|nr:hypothetical protein [Amycolatopsis sp.]HKS46206.1 hypothetical protein [Amycolatopsis sp.]